MVPADGLIVVVSPTQLRYFAHVTTGIRIRRLDGPTALIGEIVALSPTAVLLELGVLEMVGPGIVPAVLASTPTTKVIVQSADPARPQDETSDHERARRTRWSMAVLIDHPDPTGYPAAPGQSRASTWHERPRPRLSPRETQVLRCMAMGYTNTEIAHRLAISEDTVKTHSRRLYSQLNARDRAQAVAIGVRTGLIG